MIIGIPMYREKDGNIQAIIPFKTNDGKWKQKSKQGFRTKHLAVNWVAKTIPEMEKKCTNDVSDYQDITFYKAWELYYNTKGKKLRKNTKKHREYYITFAERIYHKKVTEIKPIDLLFIESLDGKSTGYSVKLTISPVFNFCKNVLKIIQTNPCTEIKADYTPPDEKSVVSKEELEHILPTILDEYFRLSYKTFFNTGVRISELFGITVNSLSKYSIKIDKQFDSKNKTFEPLKNSTKRIIPITKEFYQDLSNYITKQNLTGEDRIFQGSPPYMYKRVTRDIGSLIKGFTPHSFRHSFATHLISNNVDIKTVATLLGDTVETVLKTYSQKDEERINSIVEHML